MISSFRHYLETWYVRAFFLLMVASFILWGVGDMLRVIGTDTWAAKVGGTTIEAQALEASYRRDLSTASRDLPAGQEPSAELRRQVGEQTLQRMISQAAMNQELRNLRIVVPEPVLLASVRNMAAFKADNGSFDKARFDALLRNNGLSEAGFLDLMRGDLARKQLLDAVMAGARVPDSEAGPIYASQYEKRSADIAAFPISAAPEAPVPDDATAHRWFDNHPDLYATPEFRRVKLIVVSPATLASEITVTDKDLQTAYEEHQSDYTTIARRSAQVISTTDEAKAKALADQWRAGADWPTMEAAAKAAGAASIVQDDATERQFPDPDLAKAVFTAEPDTVPRPVKGALGWFVIRVNKAVPGGTSPFEEVKDKLRQRVVTERALEQVYERANKLDGLMGNGATLDSLPSDPGISAVTLTLDQRGNAPDDTPVTIPGEPEVRSSVLAAAFEAQKGDPPHLIEVQTPSTGGSGYFALVVEDITPPGQKPFEQVRGSVIEDWRADQRRHTAEQAATAMLTAIKGGKAFSDAARDAGVTPSLSPLVTRSQTDPSMPAEVQRVLFTLKKDQPTMVETADGFLIATPVEIVSPDPAADAAGYEQLRAAVARTVGNDLATTFSEALRLRANPRINQANVDQIVQP
jgi:peptidyl-prolyl cis-trans isomerase D